MNKKESRLIQKGRLISLKKNIGCNESTYLNPNVNYIDSSVVEKKKEFLEKKNR